MLPWLELPGSLLPKRSHVFPRRLPLLGPSTMPRLSHSGKVRFLGGWCFARSLEAKGRYAISVAVKKDKAVGSYDHQRYTREKV